jgi:hypothetical protein
VCAIVPPHQTTKSHPPGMEGNIILKLAPFQYDVYPTQSWLPSSSTSLGHTPLWGYGQKISSWYLNMSYTNKDMFKLPARKGHMGIFRLYPTFLSYYHSRFMFLRSVLSTSVVVSSLLSKFALLCPYALAFSLLSNLTLSVHTKWVRWIYADCVLERAADMQPTSLHFVHNQPIMRLCTN